MLRADNIKKYRNAKSLSMEQVRKMTGLSKSTISDSENSNGNPTEKTLEKLAEVYNVKVDDFYKDNFQEENHNKNNKLAAQAKYIESIKLDSPEEAMKFILQQPSLMQFGEYDLNEMSE
jgi:transcriptional regulator with XRE-family HTH domain